MMGDHVADGAQPLIGWNGLTLAARNALHKTNSGKANVLFFANNLGEAWRKDDGGMKTIHTGFFVTKYSIPHQPSSLSHPSSS